MSIEIFEMNDKRLFELRGPSGGVVGSYILYLIEERNNIYYSYPIEFKFKNINNPPLKEQVLKLMEERYEEFKESFKSKIKNNVAHIYSISDGDLGTGIDGIIIEL